ncbi:MAG: PEP-utilizing enzyme [Dehalococcoidia bacterium]
MAEATKRSFTDPHDVQDIPGTEGWREMYPYYYLFSKEKESERAQYESSKLWYYDGVHYPQPMYPFDLIWDDCWHIGLSVYNTRVFCVPPSYGIDHRIVNGYIYISPVLPKPEDIESRVPLFEKRSGYYYENWDSIWEEWKVKFKGLIDELKAVQFAPLPSVEDEAVVFERRGYTSADTLLREYDRLIELAVRAWQYHFEMLNLTYASDVVFMETMRTLFPGIADKTIEQITSGLETDAEMFVPPIQLQRLAKSAMASGIADAILDSNNWYEMVSKLQQTEDGRKWLEDIEGVREPWFEMSIGTGWYHTDVAWNDNLDIPLAHLKNYILALKRGEEIERQKDDVVRERNRVTEEYRGLIKNDADRETFDRQLDLVRRTAYYPQGHEFYVENWFHSVFWRKVRELGQAMAEHEALKDPEDIWFLSRFELYPILYDISAAWATGVPAIAKYELPDKIERRKEIYEKFQGWRPPPALGPAPEQVTEPFTIVMWGVTTDKINMWLEAAGVRPEEATEVRGMPGSPGVAEGTARVCFTPEEIGQLEQGEILVAPTTSSSWAPAFQILKAVVTDVGGTFCHAAVVSREYKLPSVMGVGTGTAAIRTGDKIRVDGDSGRVSILERA